MIPRRCPFAIWLWPAVILVLGGSTSLAAQAPPPTSSARHHLIAQGSTLDSGPREKSIGQHGDRHDPYRPGFGRDR